MIEVLVAVYFSLGLILVLFGPAKYSIAREVEQLRGFKPNLRSPNKTVPKNKILLFRLIITVGFILLWPLFLPGVIKDTKKFTNFEVLTKPKGNSKGKKFKCPKCNKKEAVQILYGYPSQETFQAWQNNEIELGGCIVGREMFNRKCINCNYQWETK